MAVNYFIYVIILLNLIFQATSSAAESNIDSNKSCNFKFARSKNHYASKTAYRSAVKDTSLNEKLQQEVNKFGCKVQQVWLLSRHGARYPLKNEVKRMGATLPLIAQELVFNHKEGRGCFTKIDAKKLEDFILPFNLQDSGQLHEAGADEQYALGQFWKKKFPEIFDRRYDEKLFKVEFTTANRTAQSAYHFLKGMFGDEEVAKINLPSARKPNYKLRPYKDCPIYVKDVLKNKNTYKPQSMYELTDEFKGVLEKVSERLGYEETLPVGEIIMIYDECRFETAWWPDLRSVWCKAFTEHDLRVFEHHQALKFYYEDSYGGPPLNAQLGCVAASDLYRNFRDVVAEASSVPKALLYFSHDRLMLQFLTALGLFQPSRHLEHHNRKEQQAEGRFEPSKILPFSSNVAFALYNCSTALSDGGFSFHHRVAGFMQGEPMSLTPILCPDPNTVSCPWPLHALPEASQHCNLRKVCHQHDEL